MSLQEKIKFEKLKMINTTSVRARLFETLLLQLDPLLPPHPQVHLQVHPHLLQLPCFQQTWQAHPVFFHHHNQQSRWCEQININSNWFIEGYNIYYHKCTTVQTKTMLSLLCSWCSSDNELKASNNTIHCMSYKTWLEGVATKMK